MAYEDLLSGLVELHVLYHAVHEEIFGLGMREELERHGYRISPGTLYPLLHRLRQRGYLKVREVRRGRTRRRLYRATPKGRKALAVIHHQVRELIDELEENLNHTLPRKRRS
jgi:PadR family transcriptional regulator, regulatory protein PadR